MQTAPRNAVTVTPPAESLEAAQHFARRLELETDCWDVHEALRSGEPGFVLLDVRGRAGFDAGHVSGAIHLPHAEIDEDRLAGYADDTLFVVYCAGPHCNGAQRAALRLARLGRPVKEMLGGIEGWIDEGFVLEGAVERRHVTPLGVERRGRWVVKPYGLAAGGEPPAALVRAALERVVPELPAYDDAAAPNGAAFFVAHEGRDAHWVVLGWWRPGAVLQTRVFNAPHGDPTDLSEMPPGEHLVSAWEHRVIHHECEAWRRALTAGADDPDVESYLRDRREGTV